MGAATKGIVEGTVCGLWTLQKQISATGARHKFWQCLCSCGTSRSVTQDNLLRGKSTSCGCDANRKTAARNTTHGLSRTPLIGVWRTMRSRCGNPKHRNYGDYGGRGITVYEPWHVLENFVADVGPHPGNGLTFDRINNDLGYQPGNVRWATRAAQARNQRGNSNHEIAGRTLCITDWAQELGVTANHLYRRIGLGMSFEQAVEDIKSRPPKVRGAYRPRKGVELV